MSIDEGHPRKRTRTYSPPSVRTDAVHETFALACGKEEREKTLACRQVRKTS